MRVGNSEMDFITLIFISFQLVLFVLQLSSYREAKNKKDAYLAALFLLYVLYNTAGGLFPDKNIKLIDPNTQLIIAYGCGFTLASYLPYFFYKYLDLAALRFHAYYGAILFLIAPFLLFFVIYYIVTGDIEASIKIGLTVPAIYVAIVVSAIHKALKAQKERRPAIELIMTYCVMIPWAILPFVSFFNIPQAPETLLTNSATILLFIVSIKRSYQRPTGEPAIKEEEETMTVPTLTIRENEVSALIAKGLLNKEVSVRLSISEKTVETHLRNTYRKLNISNKTELALKIGENKKNKSSVME